MAYESTESLKRRIESLSTPMFAGQGAGLANAIRARRGRKYEEQLGQVEQRNQANRAQELAMLLRGAETGRVGDFMGAATLDQAKFTDPTVQELAAKLKLEKASQKQTGPISVPANARLYDPTTQETLLDAMPNMSGTTSIPAVIQQYEYAEDLRKRDPESYARFMAQVRNPYFNAGGEFVNPYAQGDTIPTQIPRTLAPGDLPATRGEQAAAVQAAQTAAMQERIPIEAAQAGAEQAAQGSVERFYAAIPKAEAAAQTIRAMDQFLTASPNTPEGSLQPIVTSIKNLIASTGGNPSGLTDTNLMQAAIAGTLSTYLNDMGARLTDNDMRVLAQSLPQISTSREAREAVANVVKENSIRALQEFSSLEEQMRSSGVFGNYAPPLPFLETWRQSRQPPATATPVGRFEVIENR